jgi:hypothetical protein
VSRACAGCDASRLTRSWSIAVDSQIVWTGKLFATANIGRLNNDAKRASEAVVQAVKASGKHGPENSDQLIGLFAD